MLSVLRAEPQTELVCLLTTVRADGTVPVHEVAIGRVEEQAAAVGLPLRTVELPWPCPNHDYEQRFLAAAEDAAAAGATHIAFGDLYLSDIRAYRETLVAKSPLEPLFPIWCGPDETAALARSMLAAGFSSVVTAVDERRLDPSWIGRRFDEDVLDELPAGVDPCGENGEFHSFCDRGPIFSDALDGLA
jgi:diphthamide synthase (EF-2-diphthine--ammonia ligase)